MYWLLAAALVIFGYVAIFSVGAPFLVLGIALLVLGPWRDRPQTFWPPLVAVVLFFVGYIVVAPVTCTATAQSRTDSPGVTVCSNLLGLDYSGTGVYNPPVWPALLAGLGLAVTGGLTIKLFLRRKHGVG